MYSKHWGPSLTQKIELVRKFSPAHFKKNNWNDDVWHEQTDHSDQSHKVTAHRTP